MSSMFRNLGSAVTMGAMETTRAKGAREGYIERYSRHEERHEAYKEFVNEAGRSLEDLREQAQKARESMIDLEAVAVDGEGNLQTG